MLSSGRGHGKPVVERPHGARSLLFSTLSGIPGMGDKDKTKQQLMDELAKTRQRVAELEKRVIRRKRAETKAQGVRGYAEAIIETVREPLLVLDGDLKIVSANRSFYQTFKVTPRETLGRLIYDLGNRQWDIPRLRVLLEEILPKRTHFGNFEVEHDFPAIGHKVMRLDARQVRQEEAISRKMILLAAEDVTRFRRLERERKDFLSMFAHDMKNSVVASQGFLSRLISGKAGVLTKKQQNYLEIIEDELRRLSQFIADFLEFARFDAKEYKPLLAPCDVQAEIQKTIEAVALEAQRKRITIAVEPQGAMVPMINADADKLSRVLRNLLDNAVKYTGEGGTITVELADRGNETLVSFTDTGIGIPEDQMRYIFDAFYRVSRDSKGSGLGLAIAKAVVEGHGGRIWAENAPVKGSVLSFTLPKQ
jgi:signal transduction histidine kinase